MNANLPQLDLPRDYVVGNDITEAILNFYKQTCRLKAGIFALCVEGNLRASINLTEYTLKPNKDGSVHFRFLPPDHRDFW